MQLSSKELLRPFNVGISKERDDRDETDGEEDDVPNLEDVDEDEDDNEPDDVGECEGDMEDDGVDELGALTEPERKQLLTETAAVREMVTKVRSMFRGSSVCD